VTTQWQLINISYHKINKKEQESAERGQKICYRVTHLGGNISG